ncbi:hypothetical protein HDU86_006077 [Geranomyces michiganensis]|nr:hypothetical protein HDU86_006077 [Geranomyces michiganensis]
MYVGTVDKSVEVAVVDKSASAVGEDVTSGLAEEVSSELVVPDGSASDEVVVSDTGTVVVDVVLSLVLVGGASSEVVVAVVIDEVQVPPTSGDAPDGQTQPIPDGSGTLSAVQTQSPLPSATVPEGHVHPPAPSSILSEGHTQIPVVVFRDFGAPVESMYCPAGQLNAGAHDPLVGVAPFPQVVQLLGSGPVQVEHEE